MAKAQYNLGTLYFKGKGVSKDAQLAFTWSEEAAQPGGVLAQYGLGIMLAHGLGVPQSEKQGLYWFQKAAG